MRLLFTLVLLAVVIAGGKHLWFSLVGAPSNPSAKPTDSMVEISRQDGLLGASEEIDRASRNLDGALENIRVWETEVESFDGESLSTINGDSKNAARLAALKGEDRISKQQVLAARESVDKFRSLLDSRMNAANSGSLSSPEQIEFRRIAMIAEKAKLQWASAAQRIRALSQVARVSVDGAAESVALPASATQVLESLDNDMAMAEAERDLMEQALSAEVLGVLAPFTEARYVQPKMSGASVKFIRTFDKKPMSLIALRNAGALLPGMKGLQSLAKIGTDHDLPEPRWSMRPFPQYWSESEQEKLKDAQRYLQEYGETLVKAGKLSE